MNLENYYDMTKEGSTYTIVTMVQLFLCHILLAFLESFGPGRGNRGILAFVSVFRAPYEAKGS